MANSSPFAQENIEILKVVSEELADALEEQGRASEEMLRKLCRSAVQCVYDNALDELAIDRLAESVDVFYNYSNFEKDEERAFDMGACWAIVVSIRNAASIVAERAVDELLEGLVTTHAKLLATLAKKPGISQGELARILGKKPSRQSQIMSELREHNLVSSVRCGKTKSYYLTNKARQILQEKEGRDGTWPSYSALGTQTAQDSGNELSSVEKLLADACKASAEIDGWPSDNLGIAPSIDVGGPIAGASKEDAAKEKGSSICCSNGNSNNVYSFSQYYSQAAAQRM